MGEIGAASAPHPRPVDKICVTQPMSASHPTRDRPPAPAPASGDGRGRRLRRRSRRVSPGDVARADDGAAQGPAGGAGSRPGGAAGRQGQRLDRRPGLGRRRPPLADDARFEIGSITKTFTALLLADAVVRRTLALDDPVESALPAGLKLRDAADAPIRWLDLATHRSGLPRLPTNLAPQDHARSLRRLRRGAAAALPARLQADGWPATRAGSTRTSASACSAMRSAAPPAAATRNCSPSACSSPWA